MIKHVSSYSPAVAFIATTFAVISLLPATPVRADPVEDLVTFSAGTTARADEVNGNFSEVADSVNDNAARVAALEAEITELQEQLNPEPFHVVGETGEPAFSNGGDGDCQWQNAGPGSLLFAANPASFYKDSGGIVHLAGLPTAVNGPGGDATCDSANDDLSDLVIFQLPDGYQPEHLEVFASGNSTVGLNLIAPQGGVVVDGQPIPGGSVFVSTIQDGNATTLDGFTFRAASTEAMASSQRAPISVSLQTLRDLLD